MPAGWAAAIAAVAGVAGAGIQADSARGAANQQSDAARKASAEGRRQFDVSRADTAAWRNTGEAAIGDLGTMLGQEKSGVAYYKSNPRYQEIYKRIYDAADQEHRNVYRRPMEAAASIDPDNYRAHMQKIEDIASREFAQKYPEEAAMTNRSDPNFGSLNRKFSLEDFQNDPVSRASFEFGLSEGEKAVNRMFGARGMSRSGAAVKAASRFATDYTGSKAGESRDRYVQDQTNLFNRYAAVSGIGQTSATNNAQNAMTLGANNAQLIVGEGNARGAATIARGNAAGGAVTGAGNQAQNAYWMNRVYSNPSSSGSNPNATYGQDDYSGGYY